MRRQLMQQLSHTILLSGTVDVWHFVVGYLGEVQANLQEEGEKEEKISMKNEADWRRMSAGMQLRGVGHTLWGAGCPDKLS